MHTKEKRKVIYTRVFIAACIAAYVLFPFILLVINSAKETAAITANPVSVAGASLKTFGANINAVINDPNFKFWNSFMDSAIITVLSLVLLA